MARRARHPSPLAAGLLLVLSLSAIACDAVGPPTAPTDSAPPTAPGRYDVTIRGGGVMLGGTLFRPDAADARPAIVVLHGWLPSGANAVATIESRARQFAANGYVSLALALRGWFPSGGADDCGLRQPDDVVAALEWVRTLPGVRSDRIALVGFSQGGQVALLTAARDPRLRGVVAYYPVTDIAAWKATTTNVDIPSYVSAVCEPGGAEPRSPLQRATAIQPAVLLIHGDRDTRVPTEQSVWMQAALRASGRLADLVLVPGAQHGFTVAEDAAVRPAVDAFLAEQLR